MIRKFANLKKFSKILNLRYFLNFNRSFFCNILRLDIEKLKFEKDIVSFDKTEAVQFNIDENIIEYKPGVNWEETVLKSEIPVVVDVYAK
jgi:hypothetical protein